ncbi:bifunctional diaminohydroxyphosphoribosylaminopyrimidine deaminase/5-amino-6-(5-phosphoribosylamino)uracil reductase RibD [Tahibacter amnicola]|uniref:Riboflavin biosynthesis protein RibD n=1 Tax=Tahibacter amnicola TaxID=2976241 RepID=A0ABY6BCK2_9GAMM|nr:bifunctional diaminohydroxyphosphoribosylaminopyrimidine deaminase/5-amino-6-(5-phosphoribosylamino)uracil reductase RibD [Tahibacter amnicola]UXI67763.1 bifunctional diaminohydroxyphosphoribosylaminopyrimidine deaminase/5-amino-6-(5-phosphoribosylamino)uracil reductase RibD [Tahibacter amnicola]
MTAFSATDHRLMARALQLAALGTYTTAPNPRVGCVIAHGERVVGEGWHQRAGEPHAEVFALRQAGAAARGATAYVTLEPCAHFGRTPPCADALVTAGVARVVVAIEDSFAQVDGAGLRRLRQAGVTVDVGLMTDAAWELNRGFLTRTRLHRPWVRLKLAQSLDGRTGLANGESKWITGEAAREDVQHWRARSSVILTGAGTARADNPRLTVRLAGTDVAPPLRAVVDSRLDALAPGCHLLDGSVPTVVFHRAGMTPAHPGYTAVECVVPDGPRPGVDLPAVLGALAARGANEVQVEAGPVLCGALFAAGLVDEILLYVAPVFLGDAARPLLALPTLTDMTGRWHLRLVEQRQVGDDMRLLLRPADRGVA